MSLSKNDPNRKAQEILFEDIEEGTLRMFRNRGLTFFEPSMKFVRWIAAYANDRLIIEVGCGTAHVLHLLQASGYNKIMGFEPEWDVTVGTIDRLESGLGTMHILPYRTQENIAQNLLKACSKGDKAILLACRPCHGDFVEVAVDALESGTEVMYITKPENIEKYSDLGRYQHLLQEVEHEGSSTDDEKVYVFRKP